MQRCCNFSYTLLAQVLVVANLAGHKRPLSWKISLCRSRRRTSHALRDLVHNRALVQVARRLPVSQMKNVIAWSNHQSTQHPDANRHRDHQQQRGICPRTCCWWQVVHQWWTLLKLFVRNRSSSRLSVLFLPLLELKYETCGPTLGTDISRHIHCNLAPLWAWFELLS